MNKEVIETASAKSGLSYDTEVLVWIRGACKAVPIRNIVEAKSRGYVYTAKEDRTYRQEIVQWRDCQEQEVFEYTLENGEVIKATKDHKFIASDGQMLSIEEIYERGLDLWTHKPYVVDGYDFKSIIPDRYHCPARYGNHCHFNIIKFDSSYIIENDGCTEGYRTYADEEQNRLEATKDYETGFNNWMLSKDLSFFYDENDYSNFFVFVNDCINGYRNITYVKQQQVMDSNFTWEEGTTPKHTYTALNNAIAQSIKLYESLRDLDKFGDKHLLGFSHYLRYHRFSNRFRDPNERTEHIEAVKDIFDCIVANPDIANNIVTEKIVSEFRQQYR